MSKFVITIKAARVTRNLSQQEVADKLGVHVQTYRKWENNPDLMEIGKAKKLANILNISYDDIFFNSNSTLKGGSECK